MNGLRRIVYLFILLALFQSPSGQNSSRHILIFRQAEELYNAQSTTAADDSMALSMYLKVIALHNEPDSILWVSNFKAGIYLQTAGSFEAAIPYFKKAILIGEEKRVVAEDHLYLPNLYLGNSYYSVSMLDSAVHFYKLAEAIAGKHPGIEGIERLYNTLGAVNYESGDYLQSKIYFEKSLQLAKAANRQPDDPLVINYKNNLATSLRQLKDYESAMSIFSDLLRYNISRNEILHNIGTLNLEQGKDSLALVYLLKVGYDNQNKFNDLGIVYTRLKKNDSALAYFRKASDMNATVNGDRKNIQQAITCTNLGDHYLSIEDYDSALIKYQQAIVQLVFDFDEEDVRLNPVAFNGQYYVNELFGALSSKARTFTIRFNKEHNKNDLLSAVYAYEALYKLADFVIRSYNSEEARLLLSNRKHLSHNEPIAICLKLYEITSDEVYLRHAFRFDEKNKATLLALQLQENRSITNAGLPSELIKKQRQLKKEITQMQLLLSGKSDSAVQVRMRDRQIELSDLHKKFNEYSGYKKIRYIDNTIDVKKLQQLIPDDYAVLSYHLGDTSMLGFVITANTFRHISNKIDSTFSGSIRKMYDLIQVTDQNVTLQIENLADSLYAKLIQPFSTDIGDAEHLMIIPDDELSYLPFELLRQKNKPRLLEKYSVAYNYSCSLLQPYEKPNNHNSALAMAPFIKTLPASGKEISNINGDRFSGEKATKEKFMDLAGKYSIIHLATHATANDKDPAKSFIEFYPRDSVYTSSRLFTKEVAALDLGNVNLVILSACETGKGQLVKGEGLMSITRAFSSAGCRNTIASLWRADDVSTATISGYLHKYIGNGKSYAEALQQAKTEYLQSAPERFQPPAFWAHLRLIGSFEKDAGSNILLLLVGIVAVLFIGVLIYFSRPRS